MINVFIERDVYHKIENHLKEKEISLLIGPRQSGKTTILKKLFKHLQYLNKRVFYYNLDIVSDKRIVVDQTAFLHYLKNQTSEKESFIIIDEIQRLENPGLYLKGIYDTGLPYKLIVSGSSSLEIRARISEPLTGRKKVFYLSTLTFPEFVRFRMPEIDDLEPIKETYLKAYHSLLDEFIRFGGYPKVVTAKTDVQKKELLEEIYSSYIEKDIKGFFNVKNETSFFTLVMLLAGQLGGLTNKNLLSTNTGSNRPTIDNYLKYLENSFVIKMIPPFFRNPEKEIIKCPKIYFLDTGLRNIIVKNFNSFSERADRGVLLENFVLLQLIRSAGIVDKIYHWRTKTKAEVDFIVQKGVDVYPVEVKAQRLKKTSFSRSFRSFVKTYKPEKGYIVNLSLDKKNTVNSTIVETLPFYKEIFYPRS